MYKINTTTMNRTSQTDPIRQLPIWLSLVPVLMLIAMIVVTIRTFGSDSLSGAIQVVLIASSAVCCVIGMAYGKVRWKVFERMIMEHVASVSSALIILLLIGALGGAWMVSGIVPTMIYYGVKIIHPDAFLVTTCIISAVVSVMTGSSWTTIATIGVALMGIGKALGFEEGWIAGAVISGAYFGDKISPLSDTTVLASGACGVNLFTHIRNMMVTTVPSMTVALIIFLVAGLANEGPGAADLDAFRLSLAERFDISLWLMVVPLCTAVMIVKKVPALVTLFAASLMGIVAALLCQQKVLGEVAGGGLFAGAMQSLYGGTALESPNAMLTELIATRGMAGMMPTIWLILCAMCFGATLTAGGMTAGITRLFTKVSRGRVSAVASTVTSGVVLNASTSDQYISILLTSSVFRDIYDKLGLERKLLSRATEDSATVTSVLIPWSTCGMVQSTVLGVATLSYLPFCFFNLISPFMSVVMAFFGGRWEKSSEKVG